MFHFFPVLNILDILDTITMALATQDLLNPKQIKSSSLISDSISTGSKVQFTKDPHENNHDEDDDEHHKSNLTLSEDSNRIETKSSSYRNIGLRSNLTRHLHNRDPLFVRIYFYTTTTSIVVVYSAIHTFQTHLYPHSLIHMHTLVHTFFLSSLSRST